MPRANESVNYQYDAFGRRVVRQDKKTGRTEFTHDGMDVIQDRFEKNDGSTSTTNYVNGLGIDDKLKITTGTTSKYFLTDHLGSTVGMADTNGNVTESATYDSFGRVQSSNLTTRYGYTGREADEKTGLMYYRARFYDPQIGRFTSEDPIGFEGGDVNLYGYVWNNPQSHTDPMGLDGWGNDLADWMDKRIEVAREFYQSGEDESAWNEFVNNSANEARGIADLLRVGSGIGHAIYDENLSLSERAILATQDGIRAVSLFQMMYGATSRFRSNSTQSCNVNDGTCFVAGTLVETEDGEKPIEEIKEGDVVLAAEPENSGIEKWKEVVCTFVRTSLKVLDIQINDETITATPDHPFWVVGVGWVEAKDLQIGAPLLTKDYKVVHIDSIKSREGNFKVYNFEVKDSHTYFVSGLGILVHNANYRARKLAVENPPNGMGNPQVHHDMPQAFRARFRQANIDIDDPDYTRWVQGGNPHQRWSAEFNRDWQNFFNQNPNANRNQILNFMRQMRNDPRFPSM